MTIAEQIQLSTVKTRFTLFKEGLFYKGSKVKNKQGIPELQIIVSFN